jgi:hypothetical protein
LTLSHCSNCNRSWNSKENQISNRRWSTIHCIFASKQKKKKKNNYLFKLLYVRLVQGVRILKGIELEIGVVYEFYIYIASKKKARQEDVPVGYRFFPKDDELISEYVLKKVLNQPLSLPSAAIMDNAFVYGSNGMEPWNL